MAQQQASETKVQVESPERLARPLIQLAKAMGIATSYIDQLGTYVEIRDEVLVSVLGALGVDATSEEKIAAAHAAKMTADHELLAPHTMVKFISQADPIEIRTKHGVPAITLTLENETDARELGAAFKETDGDVDVYELTIDDETPAGYHTVRVVDGEREVNATLLVAPARIPVPATVQEQQRWGWMTQMYSVRSDESWGVGDYGDLRIMLRDAAKKTGADFMLINPIHATAPVAPLEPSPYLPESRRFQNVTYIRPQDIAEWNELEPEELHKIHELHDEVKGQNTNPNPMDINAAWTAKRAALELIFHKERSAERQAAFDAFKREAGEDLEAFALWSVAFEVWGAPWMENENPWFRTTNKNSPEVQQLKEDYRDLFEFQCWLQWIADEQIHRAQVTAKESGMALGLMQDMAVGIHEYSADVWWSPERFAVGNVTVGCPPDFYNQQGQDWGQPPFNPNYLEATGFAVYRQMVHNVFRHAGAVRIDHVLGLFRLWWIPAGEGARGGAYVAYNVDAMLAILTIEAIRANGMVIGEDLGTVPPYVSRVLAQHGVLGTTVEWFAREDNSPNAGDPYENPKNYREYSLASVTTHDLPPTSGYLQFEQVKLREDLHLLTEPVEEFKKSAEAEQRAMLKLLVDGGWLDAAAAQDVPAHIQEIVEAMHAMLKASPSLLLQAALVDGVGEYRAQNQPGTSDQYPNWRIPLCDEHGVVVPSDEVFDRPRVQSLAAVMNRPSQA